MIGSRWILEDCVAIWAVNFSVEAPTTVGRVARFVLTPQHLGFNDGMPVLVTPPWAVCKIPQAWCSVRLSRLSLSDCRFPGTAVSGTTFRPADCQSGPPSDRRVSNPPFGVEPPGSILAPQTWGCAVVTSRQASDRWMSGLTVEFTVERGLMQAVRSSTHVPCASTRDGSLVPIAPMYGRASRAAVPGNDFSSGRLQSGPSFKTVVSKTRSLGLSRPVHFRLLRLGVCRRHVPSGQRPVKFRLYSGVLRFERRDAGFQVHMQGTVLGRFVVSTGGMQVYAPGSGLK
jgi:hypothetical protein